MTINQAIKHGLVYQIGSETNYRFNWRALQNETSGSLAVFIHLFIQEMNVIDKRLFCYLIILRAQSNHPDDSVAAIIEVIKAKDSYFYRLFCMLASEQNPMTAMRLTPEYVSPVLEEIPKGNPNG